MRTDPPPRASVPGGASGGGESPKGEGILFVLSAPSGAGKTTLVRRMVAGLHGIRPSVSRTTRRPRGEERNGEDYEFVSDDDFDRMVERGEFLEWATVHGNRYGTPLCQIEWARDNRIDLVLVIDVQGAAKVRATGVPHVGIFVLPPSFADLKRRLLERSEDEPDSIAVRLAEARREIRQASAYDHVVVNDVLENAVRSLTSIVLAERRLAARGRRGSR